LRLCSAPSPLIRRRRAPSCRPSIRSGGVAFRIDSPDLIAIRARIADRFAALLTPQDQATPRLHVTVQNKVSPAEARALLADLARNFRPRPVEITGIAAYHYRGGPWEAAFARNFRGPRA